MDNGKVVDASDSQGDDCLEIETLPHDEAKRLQERVRMEYRDAFEALRDR